MKLLWAFLIVMCAAALCFGVLSFLGVAEKIAGPLASSLFGAITYVHQALEKSTFKLRLSALPQGLVTLRGFFLSPVVMFAYASLTLYAMLALLFGYGEVYGWIMATAVDIPPDSMSAVLLPGLIASSVAKAAAGYFVGRWIGSRVERYSIVVLLSAVSGASLLSLLAFYFAPQVADIMFGSKVSVRLLLLTFADNAGTMAVPGLIGAWRGRRARLTKYLGYLLGRIPDDTRLVIVNLAFEEAERISKDKMRVEGSPAV